MRLFPPHPGLSRRRVLAVVLLVSHAFVATGAPLPSKVAAPGKGGSAHPCQGRACGCSTTEQSWGDCCCLTQKEKLARAAARGISVPAPPKKSCCSTPKDREPAKPASSCCEQKHSDSASPPTVRWVSGVQAQKCRGEGPAGLLKLELVTPPDRPSEPLAALTPIDSLGGFDCRAPSAPHFPPTPPPRAS